MSEKIEDLTFDYKNEEGLLVRREVDRAVLSKGAWATIMFLYQDLDRAAGTYRAPKVAIVRYRKTNGVYRKQSSFNISSERQGRMIMEVLERWYGMTEADLPPAAVQADDGQAAPSEPVAVAAQDAPATPTTEGGDSPAIVEEKSEGAGAAATPETPSTFGGSPSPFEGGTSV